jgi:hypothetical protein
MVTKSRLLAPLPFVTGQPRLAFDPSRSPEWNFNFAARAIGWECQVDGAA